MVNHGIMQNYHQAPLITQYAIGHHMGKITVWMKVQAMKIIELLESQQVRQKR